MIALDTETTGLLAPSAASLHAQPYITEIYLVKFDAETFEPIEEFETFVKPPVPIPEFITKITGIDDEAVKDAPSFVEIYDALCEFCLGETDVLGQNICFDMEVIQHELERHNLQFRFPWPSVWHDTIAMAYPLENKRMSLGKLYEYLFDEKFEDAHRARNDVIATVKCFRELRRMGF